MICKVKNAVCCIRVLYILVVGLIWLRWLLSVLYLPLHPWFISASSPVISFSMLSGTLLISSSLPSTFSSTDKLRSVSLHSQVYEAGLLIVELSCQEDFFLALGEFHLFPYERKTVSLCLSNCHPFFLTPYLSSPPGLVDFIQTKQNDWV